MYWTFGNIWKYINSSIYHIIRVNAAGIEQHNKRIELIEYLLYSTYWNIQKIKSTLFQRYSNLLKDFLRIFQERLNFEESVQLTFDVLPKSSMTFCEGSLCKRFK